MSRFRKVDPRMWGDAKFRRLSHDAQRIWFYLLTGPETTSLPGLLVAGPQTLAEGVGLSAEAFREAFREVFREGLAEASTEARLVWLPNAMKHNRPESPNVVKSWSAHWDNVPECALKAKAYHALKAFTEGLGEAFAKAFAKGCALPFGIQEQEQEQDLGSAHSLAVAAPLELSATGPVRAAKRSRGRRPKSATPPSGFEPTVAHGELARERGLDCAAEFDAFLTKAAANGWAYADWGAAFRDWLKNNGSHKFDKNWRPSYQNPSPMSADEVDRLNREAKPTMAHVSDDDLCSWAAVGDHDAEAEIARRRECRVAS